MSMVIGYNPSIEQRLHARDRVAHYRSLRYLPSLVPIWCPFGGTLHLGSERLIERVVLLAASTFTTDQTARTVSTGHCSCLLNVQSFRASVDHIPTHPNLADFSWNETPRNLCIATIPRHYFTAFTNSSTTIHHTPLLSRPPPPVQQQ